jgi:hypothetical protein
LGGKQINVFFLEMFNVADVVIVHTKMVAKITITNKALETFLLCFLLPQANGHSCIDFECTHSIDVLF